MTPRRAEPGAGLRDTALICAIAAVAMLPELIAGPGFTDSFRYNVVWTTQFTDALIAGDPWPRWLARSWDGLGSPTFYFYPPLFFWIAGAVRLVSAGMIPPTAAATIASALVLAASGLTMRAWLSTLGTARAARLGAIAYMLAPYHLYDIYCRGALAEACAYAVLPLALLGIRRRSVPLIALGVAGLLLAHLPVALLAAITVLPAYALWTAISDRHAPAGVRRGGVRRLATSVAGGALGIALAAAYWLPALGLIRYVSADALAGAFYRPDIWFFWRPQDWPGGFRMIAIVLFTAGALLIALAGAGIGAARVSREGRFWAAIAGLGAAMVAGLLPWIWQLPLIAQVQFPWRMLVVVEFAAITAFVAARARPDAPLARIGALLLIAGAAMAAMVAQAMLAAGWHGGAAARAIVLRGHEEAPEYLPAGYPIPLDREGRADPGNIPLPPRTPARGIDPAAQVTIAGDRLAVRAPRPTIVVVRRAYFPHWRIIDATGASPPTFAHGRWRLLAWRVPAGAGQYRIAQAAAPGERLGGGISVFALLLLALLITLQTWSSFRARAGRR